MSLLLALLTGGGPPPLTGTLALTDGTDSVDASATVQAAATLAQIDAADEVFASADVLIAGSLALTDAADTVVGDGTVATGGVTGTLALVDGQDTVSAAGTAEGAPEQPVVSLGGSKSRLWRDYMPPLPEIKGKLWRLDDDDTVRAAAGFVEIVRVGVLAINDGDDQVVATGRALRMLRLVRDNPRAVLVRANPRATLRRAA